MTEGSIGRGEQRLPLFAGAIAAVENIDLKGNNIYTDSYDSGDPNYRDPITGLYPYGDLNRTKANGDVCTRASLVDTIGLANVTIKGMLKTGGGTNTVSIGASGSVGDRPWVEGNNLGIQPGHWATNFNVFFPNVSLPNTIWFNAYAASPGNDMVNGIRYQYVFWNSGDFRISNMSGNVYIGSNALLRIKITSSINLTNRIFTIVPSATLQIFMDAPTFSLTGSGFIDNQSGRPETFYFYGTPNCTNVTFGGGGAFYGCIHAPQAALNLGNVSDTYDFVGAVVARKVTMNGSYFFHFDENLQRIGPTR